MTQTLGPSTDEQARLRAVARWAAACASEALPIFEARHPNDDRPRAALDAARAYADGRPRDRTLRTVAMAAFRAASNLDEPSLHAARAASLAASIAYTHTDLQAGVQGVRQARHILGPIVHAAFALELASDGDPGVSGAFLARAIDAAPPEAAAILCHLPPQQPKSARLDSLFAELDASLRAAARSFKNSC